jgi:hypothetical protein
MDKRKRYKLKSSGKFSKLLILAIVLANIGFTAVVLWMFYATGSEPGVLIGAWFAFTTGELWALATIKRSKVRSKNEQNEQNEENEQNG